MAVTNPAQVTSAIPQLWARLTLRDHRVAGFFKNWIGPEGSGMPIIQRGELLNAEGDTIHIQTTNPLSGAGVVGDTTTLEGQEESLSTSSFKLVPELYRNAVRVNRRANKKSIVDLRSEARMRLAEWGEVKMDAIRFANFQQETPINGQTYTPNYYTCGGTDASPHIDDIAAGEFLKVEDLQKLKVAMMLAHAKPITVGGRPCYVLVTHPYGLYQLKREAEYRDWVREAHVRGEQNPFFTGATAIVDGMCIFEHERVPLVTNAGALQVAKGLCFGAEAFVEAIDENVDWDEDVFDYGLEFGMSYSFAFQPRRALELASRQVHMYAPTVA